MKYPNNLKKIVIKNTNHSNRGMSLEYDLNITNDYYRIKDIAIIYKKPTPIKIVKVDFDKIKSATITQAFFECPSTTDYNGIYKGKYIDFEAKEVKDKTSFSLSNIHNHQIDHLFKVLDHGGISFIIVRFCKINKTFVLQSECLKSFINLDKSKSISLEYFEEFGILIDEAYTPRLNYIKVIDNLYFGGKL